MGGVLSQVTIYEACKNSLTNISGQFHSKYLFAFDIEMNWLHTSLENNTSKINNIHELYIFFFLHSSYVCHIWPIVFKAKAQNRCFLNLQMLYYVVSLKMKDQNDFFTPYAVFKGNTHRHTFLGPEGGKSGFIDAIKRL